MADVAALKALLAKVEAGGLPLSAEESDYVEAWAALGGGREIFWPAQLAYGGSLDAAKALHDALLPGWVWRVRNGQSSISATIGCDFLKGQYFEADGETPARAWLIAILKALIAETEA